MKLKRELLKEKSIKLNTPIMKKCMIGFTPRPNKKSAFTHENQYIERRQDSTKSWKEVVEREWKRDFEKEEEIWRDRF